MAILAAAAAVLCIILLKYIFSLKREMRNIKNELRLTRDKAMTDSLP